MPSTLGTSIIDSLVGVIDSVRDSIHAIVGDRQYRVYVVRRTWSGSRRGEGIATSTAVELTPPPLVQIEGDDKGVHYQMQSGGREEEGQCTLREVSLTWAEGDLVPVGLPSNVEFYYRLVDQKGQGLQTRHYVPEGPAAVDLEKDIGWVVRLRRRHVNE